MIFTVTERSLYKRCRRRWNYSSKNRMGLQPIIDAPALTLGLVMHKALEQWSLHPDMDLTEIFGANAMLSLNKIREDYKDAVGVDISAVELADVKQAITIGVFMAQNYQAFYNSPVPEGFKLVAPEQRIVVIKIPGTEHSLEGRLDKLIQRESDGAYYVLDHKTYEKRPNFVDLSNNDQFLAYTYVATQALGPIQGYMYDGLWKRDKPGKNHTLGDLFHRQLFERPPYELAQFEAQLAAELDEMASMPLEGPLLYQNRRWEGCYDCSGFNKLCEAQSKDPIKFDLLLKHSYRRRDWDEEMNWLLDTVAE